MRGIERDDHFFSMLGVAVESARLGGLCVRIELDDGSTVAGVPADSPLAVGPRDIEIDHSGVRTDLVLDTTVVMVEHARSFTVERPGGRRARR